MEWFIFFFLSCVWSSALGRSSTCVYSGNTWLEKLRSTSTPVVFYAITAYFRHSERTWRIYRHTIITGRIDIADILQCVMQ